MVIGRNAVALYKENDRPLQIESSLLNVSLFRAHHRQELFFLLPGRDIDHQSLFHRRGWMSISTDRLLWETLLARSGTR